MNDGLQIIECPRDAMQGWKKIITTSDKVRYINALLEVGFHTIDYGSFVSPKLMPQMADSGEVVRQLDTKHSKTKLLAIVANSRGAEDAIHFDQIHYLGFPFSVSSTFQQRNTNSSPEESLLRVEEIQGLCTRHGKELVVYLSMGFGNPYGDAYDQFILASWMEKISALGVQTMSIADTVGLASPSTVTEMVSAMIPAFPRSVIGVHLHSSPDQLVEKLAAAFDAGCKRFDGAIGGIGGCPMADDQLVGNMDTVTMISYFKTKDLCEDLDMDALEYALQLSREIFT
jgi:hydroxymethylglutaryl-CoA lyase